MKDRNLTYYLNDILKSSANVDGKLKIIEEKGDVYIIKTKKFDLDVPKKFVEVTKKKGQ